MSSRAPVDGNEGNSERVRPPDRRSGSGVCGSADCAGESAPVETFSLLGNEDRLAILKAVIEADERGDAPVSFSTLRETVDTRDSGRFAYHLRELTGHLLIRSSDGYSLHGDCCDRLVGVVSSIDI